MMSNCSIEVVVDPMHASGVRPSSVGESEESATDDRRDVNKATKGGFEEWSPASLSRGILSLVEKGL